MEEGLAAPYKVSTWDSIPASVRDANGAWYGDYYGVMSFIVNTDMVKNVPADWADLMTSEYKGAFARAPTRRPLNRISGGCQLQPRDLIVTGA